MALRLVRMIKIDSDALLKAAAEELEKPEKKNVSIYVNVELFDEFKGACDNMSSNVMLEKLMRAFIEGRRTLKPGKG